MSYEAKILADSISPEEVRLTTLQVTMPRFILAEFNTHRMFSRNSASSRAIPPEKQIERVKKNPFVPETFNRRVKGMGVGDVLDSEAAGNCRAYWLNACDYAIEQAQRLIDNDVDKSRINRLLEPFMWHTVIVTSTEWDNFFALRDHPDAQPEMQIVADLMKHAYIDSDPGLIDYGQWHLPLVSDTEILGDGLSIITESDWLALARVSASRCARVSFDTQDKFEPLEKSQERADRLLEAVPPHLSPFEHVARPFDSEEWEAIYDLQRQMARIGSMEQWTPHEIWQKRQQLEFCGNLRGWRQYRKDIPDEANAQILLDRQVISEVA